MTFIHSFTNDRDFALRNIRSIFFLNAGMMFITYSFANDANALHTATPALIANAIGIILCIFSGYVGWKHWVTLIDKTTKLHNRETPRAIMLALISSGLAMLLWILSIFIMLRFYEII